METLVVYLHVDTSLIQYRVSYRYLAQVSLWRIHECGNWICIHIEQLLRPQKTYHDSRALVGLHIDSRHLFFCITVPVAERGYSLATPCLG
jgi:hypothetical protein